MLVHEGAEPGLELEGLLVGHSTHGLTRFVSPLAERLDVGNHAAPLLGQLPESFEELGVADNTIVVFDRIRENRGKLPLPTAPIVNRSINQTVSRTLLTSVTTLLADATSAEDSGNYERAAMLLERALRIQPRNPEVLQNMAEVQLQMRDWE